MSAKKKAAAAATEKEKTKCPIDRERFTSKAEPILISAGERQLVATPKEFATGSFGWFAGDKIVLIVDGVPLKVQVGMNFTVIGSKGE